MSNCIHIQIQFSLNRYSLVFTDICVNAIESLIVLQHFCHQKLEIIFQSNGGLLGICPEARIKQKGEEMHLIKCLKRGVRPSLLAMSLLTVGTTAGAYPLVDEIVPAGGLPIKIYKDHAVPGVYHYIPQSVEPWSLNNDFKSELVYKPGKVLTFVFRGQASVDPTILKKAAKALGTTTDNLAPIAYEKSSNLTCQNVYVGEDLTWLFPDKIGNYLEVVPVTIRTKDPDLMEEVYELVSGNGLACVVDVTFKAVSTGYHLTLRANMNEVYERFEAAFHAEYLVFELDIHTIIQKLVQDGVIKLEKFEDSEFAQTPLDAQIAASYAEITRRVIEMMFTPAPKLPAGGVPAASRPFSLRMDYQKSELHKNYVADLSSKFVSTKTTQIGLRIARE